MSRPVLTGVIPPDGIMPVLKEVEALRTSGVLRYEDGETSGEVTFIAGQLSEHQDVLPSGEDAVEVLLALRKGHYEVFQCLPALPVSQGNETSRSGSLAVHAPADLMNYCELAGLTGLLRLDREQRRAEAAYEGGELRGIRLDGNDDADLHEVFGWDEGTFEIRAEVELPALESEEPAEDPMDREPTIQFKREPAVESSFLRVVEVALSSIVEEREKRRSPDRVATVLPPKPRALPVTTTKRREPTVRIVYMGTARQRSSVPPGLPHRGRRSSSRDLVLAEATPERRGPSIAPGALEALLDTPASGSAPGTSEIVGPAPGPGEELPTTGFGRGSSRAKARKSAPTATPTVTSADQDMAKKPKNKAKRAAAQKPKPAEVVTRSRPPSEAPAVAVPDRATEASERPLASAGYMAAFVLLALGILAALAAMPPIE